MVLAVMIVSGLAGSSCDEVNEDKSYYNDDRVLTLIAGRMHLRYPHYL